MNLIPDGVTTLIFDVDNTLVDTDAAWRQALAATCVRTASGLPGTSAGKLAAAYRDVSDDLWSRYDSALAGRGTVAAIREYVWTEALAACGVTLDPIEVRSIAAGFGAAQLAAVRVDSRLTTLLARASRRYRLAACSNGERRLTTAKLRRAGVMRFMDAVTCGIDEGVRKPDPELLLRCCRGLGVGPACCLHIGDNWDNDIVAAHRAGLHPVWVHQASRAVPPAIAACPTAASFLGALLADNGGGAPPRSADGGHGPAGVR